MRWLAVTVAATLAGCSQSAPGATSEIAADASVNMEIAPSPPAAIMPRGALDQPKRAAAVTAPAAAPLLAYKHSIGLELPARAVRPLLGRHEAACNAAGATVCQVVALNTASQGRDEVSATLELRARPDWLRRFRTGLDGEARAAGGRLTASGTETEDLTRSIIDTEAQLRAKTTLRTRLERLLAERPGKLEELLQVEQELARVQGEIDSGVSQLAVMRTRVATSTLTVSYASEGALAPDGTFAPLADAGSSFLRNVVRAFAAVLTVISWVLPFALLAGVLAWAAARLRRRFGPPARVRPRPAGGEPQPRSPPSDPG